VNLLKCYRLLLYFYPNGFRNQFSEEMVEVFNQRACERSPEKTAFIAFVFREFFHLLRETPRTWIAKVMPKEKYFVFSIPFVSDYFPRPTAEERALSTPELQERHDAAKSSMFRAGEIHDFATAHRYAAEVNRLRIFLQRRNHPPKSQITGAA
jgi:hypothetical protein